MFECQFSVSICFPTIKHYFFSLTLLNIYSVINANQTCNVIGWVGCTYLRAGKRVVLWKCETCKEKNIWNRFSAVRCDLKDLNSFFVCGHGQLKRKKRLFFRILLISTLVFFWSNLLKITDDKRPRSKRWNKSDEPTEGSWSKSRRSSKYQTFKRNLRNLA